MTSHYPPSKLQKLAKGQNLIEVKDDQTGKVLGVISVETYRGRVKGDLLFSHLEKHNQYLREHPDQVWVGIAEAPGSPIPDFTTNLEDHPNVKEFAENVKAGRVVGLILVTEFPPMLKASATYSRHLSGSSLLEKLSAEEALPRAEALIRAAKK